MSELKPCRMNYFEAGMKLEVMQSEYAHIRKNDDEWEAIETAKKALHEAWNHRAKPTNDPLTLEQLRKMDRQSVYCAGYDETVLTYIDEHGCLWITFASGDRLTAKSCIDDAGCKFYVRKPEGSENDAKV